MTFTVVGSCTCSTFYIAHSAFVLLIQEVSIFTHLAFGNESTGAFCAGFIALHTPSVDVIFEITQIALFYTLAILIDIPAFIALGTFVIGTGHTFGYAAFFTLGCFIELPTFVAIGTFIE